MAASLNEHKFIPRVPMVFCPRSGIKVWLSNTIHYGRLVAYFTLNPLDPLCFFFFSQNENNRATFCWSLHCIKCFIFNINFNHQILFCVQRISKTKKKVKSILLSDVSKMTEQKALFLPNILIQPWHGDKNPFVRYPETGSKLWVTLCVCALSCSCNLGKQETRETEVRRKSETPSVYNFYPQHSTIWSEGNPQDLCLFQGKEWGEPDT